MILFLTLGQMSLILKPRYVNKYYEDLEIAAVVDTSHSHYRDLL